MTDKLITVIRYLLSLRFSTDMPKLEENMVLHKCRICLQSDQNYSSLFERFEGETYLLSDKLMSFTKITIQPDDGLPHMICSACLKWFGYCLEFIKLCEHSDSKLRSVQHEHNDLNIKNYLTEESNTTLCEDTKRDDGDNKRLPNKNKKSEKYQCFSCGKILSSRFRLKTHLITHSGERPYKCANCEKSFSLAQTLDVHMRIHTGEKPFCCSTCGKEFTQAAGLSAHKRKHTGTLPYTCKLCPEKFRTSGHLQYHIRKHTGEKNFECDVCHRAFITCHDLKRHSITHTGAKPFSCSICGLCLTRSWNLKKHLKLVHCNENKELK
ncbi:gastrula zinc finger protein XlCGF17.1-like [Leptidea sinapis]|uniref:gastrula zinc finger protein XlCGF17.1-like n=1 Tax=Leptidea sinapis TaxID=189913 RepID=UPI0021C3A2F0|nr:gastrula zinc finger protein XlCGF17.1-like [Leptidea sinapis]